MGHDFSQKFWFRPLCGLRPRPSAVLKLKLYEGPSGNGRVQIGLQHLRRQLADPLLRAIHAQWPPTAQGTPQKRNHAHIPQRHPRGPAWGLSELHENLTRST